MRAREDGVSRVGQAFDRLWPGVVVSLLAALVIGGASGWIDIRERLTRVEVELDTGLEGVNVRLDDVNARLDELVRRVDNLVDLHLRADKAADD